MSETVEVRLTNRRASFLSYYPDELSDVFAYRHPNAFFTPRYNMRDENGERLWDGLVRLIKYRALTSGAFLGFREEAEKAGFHFKVKNETVYPKFRKATEESDREFQNECTDALLKYSNTGGIVLCATGTGKTRIAGLYFRRLVGAGVFVVDELTLLDQARADLQEVLGEKVGMIGDQVFSPRRITVATVQTLHRHKDDPSYRKWQRTIEALFIDEVHQQVNRRNIDTVKAIMPKAVFGLTATLQLGKRDVRAKVYELCGPVIYRYTLEQGTKEKYLTPGICVGLDLVREDHPDAYDYQSMYDLHIVRSKRRNDLLEDLVRQGVKRGKFVILFLERVKHIRKMFKRLEDLNVAEVYGAVEMWDRVTAKKRFEKGRLQVLITNKVFKKGISINRVDAMIDGAGMKSKNDAVQKYGRGVRLCDGKSGLIYIDVGERGSRLEKATKSRRAALRKNKIPVFKMEWEDSARAVYDFAEHRLKEVLRTLRRSS